MSYLRLLALAGILLALTTCSEPEHAMTTGGGVSGSGPPFFTATLDGAPWIADTVEGIVLTPSAGGVATLVIGTRRVPRQTITLGLATFPATGQFVLGGITSKHAAFFDIDTISYISIDARPGLVSVDAVNATDSVLAGSFTFEAARLLPPDTGAHRMLSGTFRVRYVH